MTEFVLSIVTVTKNCAETINETLDSIAAVKQPCIEYIVVDGVSTDGTLSKIRARGTLVDRLVSESDTGIYNAMNKGVRLACGHFVLFINGDDVLIAEGFPVIMEALRQNSGEIICATTVVGDLEAPAETLIARPRRLPFFNSIPHPSSFVRRGLLLRNPFREDLRIVSDYDFFLGAYLAGHSFRVLRVVTAAHKRGGASGNVRRSLLELEQVRRDRLGWAYPLFNGVAAVYQQGKRLFCGKPTW